MYLVSADHKTAEYRLKDAAISVARDGDLFYVSLAPFGCGKSRATPEAAIRELLTSNGCFNIRIRKDLISEKTKQIAILKRAHDKRMAELTAQYDRATAFDVQCDLVAARIEALLEYSRAVSAICHGGAE